MNRLSIIPLAVAVILLCPPNIAANEADDSTGVPAGETGSAFSIIPHGFAGVQSFRIHRYKNQGYDYNSQIFNNSVLNFTFDLVTENRLSIRAGIEGYVTFSTVPYERLGVSREAVAAPLWSWYMAQAEISYPIGNPAGVFNGDLGVGLFPYKYNEEARNLGEYLFRSGTYPGWILTTFDWTATRLTGVRTSGTLFGNWRHDLMLTTEMEWFPFYDLSLSWLSSYKVGRLLELGAGVSFARFLPANDSLTTPKIRLDSNGVVVPGNKERANMYSKSGDTVNFDTAFYTFTGIKAMGRLTVDPLAFFKGEPSNKIFTLGVHDGKLFSEVAVLGIQNQGILYDNILQRIPVMFGFNVPTFNLLDVLAFQMEYYAMPYPNDFDLQVRFSGAGVPQPTNGVGYANPQSKYTVDNPNDDRPNFYTQDNWKWSVYARRWVGTHLAIVAQVASDHWRTSTPYSNYRDTEEALSIPSKHWYAALKIVSVW